MNVFLKKEKVMEKRVEEIRWGWKKRLGAFPYHLSGSIEFYLWKWF